MNVHRVHIRDLPVPPERVGPLIDGLGGPGDRLWPSARWPTTPLELDGPLAVGTTSRQGLFRSAQIRQVVADHEPGRRLVFRFAPGLGIVGTHTLEAQPLDGDRTRLVHTLQARLEPKMLAVSPLLIRQHDALVEDMFDRAESATTGRVARPARWPASVRIANAIEEAVARRRGLLPAAQATVPRRGRAARAAGVAAPATLLALAALHAAWALGSHWPAAGEQELAELVLSSDERERLDGRLPPAAITWSVAAGLAGAAAAVRALAGGTRSRMVRGAGWGVAGALLVRGVVFLGLDLGRGRRDRYDRLDLAVYSPLSISLGLATAVVVRANRRA